MNLFVICTGLPTFQLVTNNVRLLKALLQRDSKAELQYHES
jgi:hypothetical protein